MFCADTAEPHHVLQEFNDTRTTKAITETFSVIQMLTTISFRRSRGRFRMQCVNDLTLLSPSASLGLHFGHISTAALTPVSLLGRIGAKTDQCGSQPKEKIHLFSVKEYLSQTECKLFPATVEDDV